MCPDVADKADSGTKSSVAVRTWKTRNNHRACFHSTGFAEQSLFFRLTYPGLFIELNSLPDQATNNSNDNNNNNDNILIIITINKYL